MTLEFLRCYDRYPNPFRKLQAAQTWGELAETWPGGEKALADSICEAFDAGMLTHKPYNGDAVPKFETVLSERLWTERPARAVAAKPAETLEQRHERGRREGADDHAQRMSEVARVSREAEAAAKEKLAARGVG